MVRSRTRHATRTKPVKSLHDLQLHPGVGAKWRERRSVHEKHAASCLSVHCGAVCLQGTPWCHYMRRRSPTLPDLTIRPVFAKRGTARSWLMDRQNDQRGRQRKSE